MQKEETQVTIVKLTADPGKVFARKDDDTALGPVLWLGKEDSAENYVEVDEPDEQDKE